MRIAIAVGNFSLPVKLTNCARKSAPGGSRISIAICNPLLHQAGKGACATTSVAEEFAEQILGADERLCRVRLSRIARGILFPDRLRFLLPEMPFSCGVLHFGTELAADGILLSACAVTGCSTRGNRRILPISLNGIQNGITASKSSRPRTKDYAIRLGFRLVTRSRREPAPRSHRRAPRRIDGIRCAISKLFVAAMPELARDEVGRPGRGRICLRGTTATSARSAALWRVRSRSLQTDAG